MSLSHVPSVSQECPGHGESKRVPVSLPLQGGHGGHGSTVEFPNSECVPTPKAFLGAACRTDRTRAIKSRYLTNSKRYFIHGGSNLLAYTKSVRHFGHQLGRLSRLPRWKGRIEKIPKRIGGRIKNDQVNFWRITPLRTNAD